MMIYRAVFEDTSNDIHGFYIQGALDEIRQVVERLKIFREWISLAPATNQDQGDFFTVEDIIAFDDDIVE